MKKLLFIFVAYLALCTAHAQSFFNPLNLSKEVSHSATSNRPNPATNNLRSGGIQIALDYDSFDTKWTNQHTPPDSMYEYEWNINANNDTSMTFSLRTAVQTYDTLVDVNNNFAGYARNAYRVGVDSILFFLADSNGSGLNDTITISVFDKSTATAVEGFGGGLSFVPLWADTVVSNANIFPDGQNFYGIMARPNVTLPAGHVFGVKVDFKGDVADQLFVLATYRDQCGNQNIDAADSNLIAPHNSSFDVNLGANSGFYQYSSEIPFFNTGNGCQFFYIQNYLFYPFITLTPSTCPTITVTAAEVGNTKTASASATGGVAPYTFHWSTNQIADTATGLKNDSTYTVTATDHNGCTGTATVSISTGIASIEAGVTNFSVFPNPSNGVFTANVSLVAASDVTISVTDMTGSKIYESTDKAVKDLNKQINLSSIATGIYFVSVRTAQGTANQRIVIK